MRLAESLVEIPTPDGKISLPCMDWLNLDSFSPTFKWIVPGTSGPKAWSCEIEVSHMGKKPILYGQRWEKRGYPLRKHAYSNILKILPPKN